MTNSEYIWTGQTCKVQRPNSKRIVNAVNECNKLYKQLEIADQFALEHCTKLLNGWDREGYDLWWEIPSFYPEEAEYLIEQGILVMNDEGLVAWKEYLDEPTLGGAAGVIRR